MEIEERKDALKFLKTGALFFSFWYRGVAPIPGFWACEESLRG